MEPEDYEAMKLYLTNEKKSLYANPKKFSLLPLLPNGKVDVEEMDGMMKPFTFHDGLIFYNVTRVVMVKKNMNCFLAACHEDTAMSEASSPYYCEHLNLENTLKIVKTLFFWKNITKDVKAFCENCIHCKNNQELRCDGSQGRKKVSGYLHPYKLNSQSCNSSDAALDAKRQNNVDFKTCGVNELRLNKENNENGIINVVWLKTMWTAVQEYPSNQLADAVMQIYGQLIKQDICNVENVSNIAAAIESVTSERPSEGMQLQNFEDGKESILTEALSDFDFCVKSDQKQNGLHSVTGNAYCSKVSGSLPADAFVDTLWKVKNGHAEEFGRQCTFKDDSTPTNTWYIPKSETDSVTNVPCCSTKTLNGHPQCSKSADIQASGTVTRNEIRNGRDRKSLQNASAITCTLRSTCHRQVANSLSSQSTVTTGGSHTGANCLYCDGHVRRPYNHATRIWKRKRFVMTSVAVESPIEQDNLVSERVAFNLNLSAKPIICRDLMSPAHNNLKGTPIVCKSFHGCFELLGAFRILFDTFVKLKYVTDAFLHKWFSRVQLKYLLGILPKNENNFLSIEDLPGVHLQMPAYSLPIFRSIKSTQFLCSVVKIIRDRAIFPDFGPVSCLNSESCLCVLVEGFEFPECTIFLAIEVQSCSVLTASAKSTNVRNIVQFLDKVLANIRPTVQLGTIVRRTGDVTHRMEFDGWCRGKGIAMMDLSTCYRAVNEELILTDILKLATKYEVQEVGLVVEMAISYYNLLVHLKTSKIPILSSKR